jgi:predicted  nucleic acid-binding Zn-ribbon protein
LKEQLKLLEELQQHDARLQEIEAALAAIPARLKALHGDLQRVEDLLASERAHLAETERYRRDQEHALEDEEQLTQKAKIKLQAVKTGREYMATQRELETTRKMAQDREEEVIKLLAAIEDFKKSIAAHEADVAVLREGVAKEEAAAQTELADLEQQVSTARAGRETIARQVKPDIMRRYSSIRIRRGLAVVPVKNGTCQGCNMNVPPQLYNVLQRGGTIETCPNCHRIVYWDKLMEEGVSRVEEEQPGQQ